MTRWKETFDEGVKLFKRGRLDEALARMNQAAELENGAFIVYDSRAAVHEKLGNLKAALLDSKRVIELAPNRWQGYARSARLFDLAGKHGSAVKMADHALERLRPEDVQRRAQLVELRETATAAQTAIDTERLSRVNRTSYLLGKLPVETLVEIFSMLIDEHYNWAVKLSHVCGHWRQILLNTPSAWKTLVLSRKHPLQKAKLWKQRAQNRVTCISIAISPLDRASVFAQLQDLSWDALSSLCVSVDAFVELHRVLSDLSLAHTFPNLYELTLLEFTTSSQLSSHLSGLCWKLGVLHLTGAIVMEDTWWEYIQQLKELHIVGSFAQFSSRVFTANPLLEKLVLHCPIERVELDTDDDATPISMDKLRNVECGATLTNPFHVLRAISAPSITRFSLLTAAIKAHETLFHMASRPSLVELHIANCSLNPSTLPALLPSTPSLETLQVNAIYAVVNDMFQFLCQKTAGSLPCRELKQVDVSWCSDLATSSVYDFVKTRTLYASETDGKCAVITSLKVDGCPNIEPDMLPWFRSKVARFSCVYATKKDFTKNRRRYG